MAAVTANQLKQIRRGGRIKALVAASTILYENTLAFFNATGYADEDNASGINEFAGVVVKQVDNSAGSAGDLAVELETDIEILLVGSGFAQTSVGKPVFAVDNYTVTLVNEGPGTYVGRVTEYVSSTLAWVRVNARRNSRGVNTVQAVDNVHDTTPTAASLATAFGAAASLGRGFIGTIDDNDADAISYIVWTSDASFYFVIGTKAA